MNQIQLCAKKLIIIENFNMHLNLMCRNMDMSNIVENWEKDSFIMVAQNHNDEPPFYNEIDVKKISDAIADTTNTMYAENRYIELTQEQLDAIQEKE